MSAWAWRDNELLYNGEVVTAITPVFRAVYAPDELGPAREYMKAKAADKIVKDRAWERLGCDRSKWDSWRNSDAYTQEFSALLAE